MKIHVDSERALNLLFLVVGGAMLAEAFTFGRTAGLFPKLTGSVVVGGALLLLVQDRLPGPLRTFVAKDTQLIRAPDDIREMTEEVVGEATANRSGDLNRPLTPTVFTGLFVVLFLIASYLFGMLWMAPLFVVIYARWFEQPWRLAALLAVIAFGVAYGFNSVLNTPVDSGLLLELLGVA